MVIKSNEYWLSEAELKTPVHDEMVLWTFNNAEKIIKSLDILKEGVSITPSELDDEIAYRTEQKHRPHGCRWDWKQNKIILPSNFSDKTLVGYETQFEKLQSDIKRECELILEKPYSLFNFKKTIEFPLQARNGFNLGYIDLQVRVSASEDYKWIFNPFIRYLNISFNFEIKPEVKSIGEVLRQFQYYKSNLPQVKETILVLVTKTKGLNEVFESQGFKVVLYEQ